MFYFSADALYFQEVTLLEFVNHLYNIEGYRIFFIDEIHKYKNWNQELKNIYDSFPDIKMVYSGSSMLDIANYYDLKTSHLHPFKKILLEYMGQTVNKGSLRELFFIQALKDANIPVYFSKRNNPPSLFWISFLKRGRSLLHVKK